MKAKLKSIKQLLRESHIHDDGDDCYIVSDKAGEWFYKSGGYASRFGDGVTYTFEKTSGYRDSNCILWLMKEHRGYYNNDWLITEFLTESDFEI